MNRLWSAVDVNVFNKWHQNTANARLVESIIRTCWLDYFKQPLDTLPFAGRNATSSALWDTKKIFRTKFFEVEWWATLDLLEFIFKHTVVSRWQDQLREMTNRYFTEENAAYRFVGDEIVEITDENEVKAIESALESGISTSRQHLSRSLELISDKTSPDYRNSIKESISSVETICQLVVGNEKATLGDCLKTINDKSPIHSAFRQALSNLYGYTSDEGGIRHSLTEDANEPSYADAKFMLVICSGFINYILTKAAENGVVLDT